MRKKHPKRPFSFLDSRNMEYMKPHRYVSHKTLSETAREIGCDVSWLRKLERAGRIRRPRGFSVESFRCVSGARSRSRKSAR